MKTRYAHGPKAHIGTVWYLAPVLAIIVALLLFAMAPHTPASLADPPGDATASAAVTAPYVSSDPSLPAAASVFTGPATPYEHVATF